ncbi:MAG: PaaI family thioesterase [Nocardioides sp.]|uniref:PaaI family thioesterase n=1 Tax=Nocardioides sp. TaxID=35761 RepID=UPI003F089982
MDTAPAARTADADTAASPVAVPRRQLSDIPAETLEAHTALVHQLRELNQAVGLSTASPEVLAEAMATVRRLTEELSADSSGRLTRTAFAQPGEEARRGRGMTINVLNPSMPEVTLEFDGDFEAADRAGDPTGLSASATLRANSLHEGPTDSLHGGVSALLMDCMLGFLVQVWGEPAVTANLHTRYVARAPLDADLRLTSRVLSRSGRKIKVEGTIEHEGQVCVEASGLFVVIDRASFRPPGLSEA